MVIEVELLALMVCSGSLCFSAWGFLKSESALRAASEARDLSNQAILASQKAAFPQFTPIAEDDLRDLMTEGDSLKTSSQNATKPAYKGWDELSMQIDEDF